VKVRNSLLFASLSLLLAASAALAEPITFNIDSNHSVVGFSVRHFFGRVPGRFKEVSGTIVMDQKNLAASSVDVTIPTASITTENDRRDTHLKSPDFFAADSFPTITFKSTKVTPGADNTMKVEGNLTMRGVTRPVTLDATLMGVGDVSMGGRGTRKVAGFEAKTTVNRKDYNILWNRTLDQGGTMLGDDVAITLTVEANGMDPAAQQKPADKPAEKTADKK
jgi:polyisoprenoid-binding protein YceI